MINEFFKLLLNSLIVDYQKITGNESDPEPSNWGNSIYFWVGYDATKMDIPWRLKAFQPPTEGVERTPINGQGNNAVCHAKNRGSDRTGSCQLPEEAINHFEAIADTQGKDLLDIVWTVVKVSMPSGGIPYGYLYKVKINSYEPPEETPDSQDIVYTINLTFYGKRKRLDDVSAYTSVLNP